MTALVVFVVAIPWGLGLTWLGRKVARQAGIVDLPDGRRKIHAQPIAVIGGVAVFLASLLTLGTLALLQPSIATTLREVGTRGIWIFLGMLMIVAMGVLDDLTNLRARYKLFGQFAASTTVILGGGYLIEQVTIFGFTVALQGFALPVTLVWFVMIINAVNLLDGMDGMLGSIAVIVLGSLALMALATSNPFAVLVSSALAGSLLGFLRFNLPPASVYLGDCGSMLIGLTIAAVSVHASIKGPAFAVLVPTGLLVLPIMDTTAAIVRRKLTGRGLAVGDRGHIHHVLQRQGLTTRRVLVVVVGLGILASVGAVSSTWLQNDLLAIAMASGIVLMLIAAGLFGNAEMQLIRSRAWGLLLASNGLKQEMEVRLQGSINWSELWDDITQTAQVLDLESIWLDVNAPRWHEGYHRRWKRPSDTRDELSIWKFELPLMGQGQIIGRLVIFGRRDPVHSAIPLEELSALVHRIELTVERLTPSATDIVPVEHDTTVAT